MEKKLSIKYSSLTTFSLSAQQNSYPLLKSLSLHHSSDELSDRASSSYSQLTMRLTSDPEIFAPEEWVIDELRAGQVVKLQDRPLNVSHDLLFNLTEPLKVSMKLAVCSLEFSETELATEEFSVEVLPPNFWGGESRQPELLAAFVKPNGLYVESLVKQVTEILENEGFGRSADGYQSNTRDKPYLMAACLWNVVFAQHLAYVSPPPGFAREGQRIRLAADISSSGMCACLDTSLLFASCLELMGLNSVIALTDGHAFAGVWLIDECFPVLTNDDPMDLRKRVDSKDIILFETTLVTNVSPVTFEDSKATARELIGEDKEKDFVYVIDISQARARKIKPLSTVEVRPDEAISKGISVLPTPILPPLPPVRTAEKKINETPDTRIDAWQRKLLDLTKRNALLNLRDNAVAIRLYCPAIGTLEDSLAQGKSFKFKAAEESPLNDSGRSESMFRLQDGASLHKEFALEQLDKDILIANIPKKKLEANAVNLFRKAKNDLEEGGSNTLYLALGMLRWKENPEDDRSFRAPLILIPAELTRSSAKAPVKVRQLLDEPPIFNMTLIEFLFTEYEIDLNHFRDELPEDHSGIDVEGIWDNVRAAIAEQPGFEVVEELTLASFSFAKYLMWKDLKDRLSDLKDNLFVEHLVDNPQDAYHQNSSFVNHQEVDQKIDPEKVFTPLNCDSSQLVAVEASGRPQDFVLEGPPGTGKSETIANIICHNLALGRKVLFVAEKMAALHVVYRRMEKIGLDHLCLELHSNKANKKAVLEQLRVSTSRRTTSSAETWVESVKDLKERRNHLNRYVVALHKKSMYGISAREAITRDVFYKDTHNLSLEWPRGLERAGMRSAENLEQMIEAARFAGLAYFDVAELDASAFRAVNEINWSNAWQTQLVNTLERYRSLLVDLSAAAIELGANFNIALEEKPLRVHNGAKSLSDLVASAQAHPIGYLVQKDRANLVESIGTVSKGKKELDHILNDIRCNVSHGVLACSPVKDWISLYDESKDSGIRRFFAKFKINRAAKKLGYSAFKDFSVLGKLDRGLELLNIIEPLSEKLLEDKIWLGWETDQNILDEAVSRSEQAYSSLSKVIALTEDPSQVLIAVKSKLVDGRDFLDDSKLVSSNNRFKVLFDSFTSLTQEAESIGLTFDQNMRVIEITDIIDNLLNQAPKFKVWCEWQGAKKKVMVFSLAELVKSLESGTIPHDEAAAQVLTAFCRWLAPQLIDNADDLVQFKSSNHEQLIREFRELDTQIAKNTSGYVSAIVASHSPDPFAEGSPKEFSVLARELQKKQRHKPVRQLFGEMGNRVLDLCPCMMMSPLSVAQFLPSDFKGFDLVVFDEASQMTTWDSVGAIARGKNVIVVGDPKQMPPTSFFSGAVSDDNPDEEDLESILDQALAARLPHIRLQGHYRSRHETLIAFSNSKYYENALITYPSADTKESAVTLHRVEGVYSKGRGRNNPIEARAVVDEITRRLLDPELSNKSIGVVTLNTEQQRTIEDLLDDARRRNPEIESYFHSTDTYDGVFVKNLESVQGDERDVIILSLSYGPTEPSGKTMSMNFGPLNKSGGERRLNVAITRATTEILVFSSFDSSMVDLSRTSALAVEHLKHYLEFAERGPIALAEQATADYGVDQFDSDFEQAVAWALRSKGWKVQTQIGVSKFRVDLGVIHPDKPGVFLAGVECDGATYHGSPSARDRDRVRHDILENLGWRLVRLWSTDYFQDPTHAIETIHVKLNQLLEYDRELKLVKSTESVKTAPHADYKYEMKSVEVPSKPTPPNLQAYQDKFGHRQSPEASRAHPLSILDQMAKEALELGEPIPQWRDRHKTRLGNVNDQMYKSLRVEEAIEVTKIAEIESLPEKDSISPSQAMKSYSHDRFFEDGYKETLNIAAKGILAVKNGITIHELALDIARLHGMSRQSKKQRSHLLGIIKPWVGLVRDGIHRPVVWLSPEDVTTEICWRGLSPWGSDRDWREIPFQEAISLARTALEKSPNGPVNYICEAFEMKKRHPSTLEVFESWVKEVKSRS